MRTSKIISPPLPSPVALRRLCEPRPTAWYFLGGESHAARNKCHLLFLVAARFRYTPSAIIYMKFSVFKNFLVGRWGGILGLVG